MVRALTGSLPGGLRRRLRGDRRGAHPDAGRGDQAGVPGPGGEPEVDRRDAAPRLQGSVRAGGHRGLPVRLRRDGRGGRRLDVRPAGRELRVRPDQPRSSWSGRTRGRCAASPSGCWRPPTAACGPSRTTPCWTGCGGPTSTSKAIWRAAPGRGPMNPRWSGWGSVRGIPDLVTVRAADLLAKADVVFVPVADSGETGRAEQTVLFYAEAWRVERVVFALTRLGPGGEHARDFGAREQAWDGAAAQVAALVRRPSRRRPRSSPPSATRASTRPSATSRRRSATLVGELDVQLVPGITAMQDLAARSGTPLVEGREALALFPMTAGADRFREALRAGRRRGRLQVRPDAARDPGRAARDRSAGRRGVRRRVGPARRGHPAGRRARPRRSPAPTCPR